MQVRTLECTMCILYLSSATSCTSCAKCGIGTASHDKRTCHQCALGECPAPSASPSVKKILQLSGSYSDEEGLEYCKSCPPGKICG